MNLVGVNDVNQVVSNNDSNLAVTYRKPGLNTESIFDAVRKNEDLKIKNIPSDFMDDYIVEEDPYEVPEKQVWLNPPSLTKELPVTINPLPDFPINFPENLDPIPSQIFPKQLPDKPIGFDPMPVFPEQPDKPIGFDPMPSPIFPKQLPDEPIALGPITRHPIDMPNFLDNDKRAAKTLESLKAA